MTQLHVTVMPNTLGRDFVLGDLHGMTGQLFDAMKEVVFDPAIDRIFSVGDLIDRGPNSLDAAALLLEPWFYCVRGNHEQMAIDAIKDQDDVTWHLNGGEWSKDIPYGMLLELRDMLLTTPYAITLLRPDGRSVGIVHAEWGGDDWSEIGQAVMNPKKVNQMLWGRDIYREKVVNIDPTAAVTIHGHTPVGRPTKLGTALFIDTAAVYGGTITLLDIEDAILIESSDPDSL